MEKRDLEKVVSYLEKALDVLYSTGVKDSTVRPQYAVYLVALELAKRGSDVNLGVRSKQGKQLPGRHDIEANGMRIEVKSGEEQTYEDVPYYVATFRRGEQINNKEFDYFVFVIFSGSKAKKKFVFSHRELEEVTTDRTYQAWGGRKGKIGKTHKCFLHYFPKNSKPWKDSLDIEKDLHKHPEKYENKWQKLSSKMQ